MSATIEKRITSLAAILTIKGGKGEWQAGDLLVQKDLARTLRRIAERGAEGFYAGETAELLVKEMKSGEQRELELGLVIEAIR